MPIISPTPFAPFAGLGWNVYLCSGGPPTLSTDGTYNRGDWAIEMAPVAGSAAAYVNMSTGNPGTWKAVALGA